MYKQGEWVTVKPSAALNSDGCTAQVVRVFPEADKKAYPKGLMMVCNPDRPGVMFCDNEGTRYGCALAVDLTFMEPKP